MNLRIGFVLITHHRPEQTIFLCEALTRKFDAPPIALHHDFGQSELDTDALPKNVLVVKDWLHTSWGAVSTVHAHRKALALLMHEADPDWCISLTGTDYPIQTADVIRADLSHAKADAYIDHRLIDWPPKAMPGDIPHAPGKSADWVKVAHHRTIAVGTGTYRLMKALGMPDRQITLKRRAITKFFTPFRNDVYCYGGEVSYTVNRKAAHILLEPSPLTERLLKYFEGRRCADEAVFHTILGNAGGLALEDGNRYADWSAGGVHPKTLGYEDFPALLASQCHFARKFRMDHDMLAALDDQVARKGKTRG